MTDTHEGEPKTRRERLAAVAAEYTQEVHDARTLGQLEGERVSRYAAVTSEGSPESSYSGNGNLIVADTTAGLAKRLRQECGEGWLAHGRLWDLDAPWHVWGNLDVSYEVRVAGELAPVVTVVKVEDREDGLHLFADPLDAGAFAKLVRRRGGSADVAAVRLLDHPAAEALMDAELRR